MLAGIGYRLSRQLGSGVFDRASLLLKARLPGKEHTSSEAVSSSNRHPHVEYIMSIRGSAAFLSYVKAV